LEGENISEEDKVEVLDGGEAAGEEGVQVSKELGVAVPDGLLDSLHYLLKHFLYPHLRLPGSHSRWDDPLECFIALFSLSSTGNFKAAWDMTQPFTILHYLIRSAIFYEAHHLWKNSTGDLDFEV
jgi:hypothetical protein